MEKSSDSRKRLLAFGLSLGAHLSLFAISPLVLPSLSAQQITPASPVLLKLAQAKVPRQKKLILKAKPVKSAETKPISPQAAAVKQTSARNALWNETEFQERQKRMDEKIRDIRSQLEVLRKKRHSDLPQIEGFKVISPGLQGQRWQTYLEQVRKKVFHKWYPLLIKAEGKLKKSEVRLDFTIRADGTIQQYRIAAWQGSRAFRDLSLASFKQALPFEQLQPNRKTVQKGKVYTVSLFFYYR